MTTKTTTKTIRMDNEVAEWLRDKDARALLESVYREIKAGRLRYDGEVHGVDLRGLEDVGDIDEFLAKVAEKVIWGEL